MCWHLPTQAAGQPVYLRWDLMSPADLCQRSLQNNWVRWTLGISPSLWKVHTFNLSTFQVSYNYNFVPGDCHSLFHVGNDIVIIAPIALAEDSIIVYTQNSVLDSESKTGPQVVLNANVSLQFIQCSKSLVTQTAQVNIDSGVIVPESLNPTIQKTHSKWQTYDTLQRSANGTTLLASDYVSDPQKKLRRCAYIHSVGNDGVSITPVYTDWWSCGC